MDEALVACDREAFYASEIEARERHRVKLVEAVGQLEAGRWTLSVLCDHAGVVTQPGMA